MTLVGRKWARPNGFVIALIPCLIPSIPPSPRVTVDRESRGAEFWVVEAAGNSNASEDGKPQQSWFWKPSEHAQDAKDACCTLASAEEIIQLILGLANT